jgi:hypothetical protein
MDTLGFLGILSLFVGMIALCFFWGVWEWKKPKDPGPLFIDLDRTIKKRLKKQGPSMSRALSRDNSAESGQIQYKLTQAAISGLINETFVSGVI